MYGLLAVTKALSDVTRLHILMVLRGRELSLFQIALALHIEPSIIDRHLALLEEAGLVQGHRPDRQRCFSLAGPERRTPVVRDVLALVGNALWADHLVVQDENRLRHFLGQSGAPVIAGGGHADSETDV